MKLCLCYSLFRRFDNAIDSLIIYYYHKAYAYMSYTEIYDASGCVNYFVSDIT